jgi:transketolase
VKPIDGQTLRAALEQTGLIVVAEDHWVEGGLGDAVLEALAARGTALSGRVIKLAVTEMPGSGSPEELRDWAGISAQKIARAVRSAVGKA